MALNKLVDNNATYPLTLNTLKVDGSFTSSGSAIILGGSQSTVGLIVRQSQTTVGTDLQQWQQGDGFVWGRVNSQGELQFGANGATARFGLTTNVGAATVAVATASAAYTGIIIRGSVSQSGDYLQVQNSSNNVVSSITAGGVFNINSSQYGNTLLWAAPASTTYYLLATLPISSAGTYDHLQIEGIHGGWGSGDFAKSTFTFANRNFFSWRHYLSITGGQANFKLRAYSQVDGSVQIWASGLAGQFLKFAYNVSSAQIVTTVTNPTATTTAPSGTVVFDSSDLTTYPPVETRHGGISVLGTAAATVTSVVRGASGQSTDVQQWQSWDGTTATTIAKVASNGVIFGAELRTNATQAVLREVAGGGNLYLLRATSTPGAPGTSVGSLYFRDGTTSGLRLATISGASGVEETLIDNINVNGTASSLLAVKYIDGGTA